MERTLMVLSWRNMRKSTGLPLLAIAALLSQSTAGFGGTKADVEMSRDQLDQARYQRDQVQADCASKTKTNNEIDHSKDNAEADYTCTLCSSDAYCGTGYKKDLPSGFPAESSCYDIYRLYKTSGGYPAGASKACQDQIEACNQVKRQRNSANNANRSTDCDGAVRQATTQVTIAETQYQRASSNCSECQLEIIKAQNRGPSTGEKIVAAIYGLAPVAMAGINGYYGYKTFNRYLGACESQYGSYLSAATTVGILRSLLVAAASRVAATVVASAEESAAAELIRAAVMRRTRAVRSSVDKYLSVGSPAAAVTLLIAVAGVTLRSAVVMGRSRAASHLTAEELTHLTAAHPTAGKSAAGIFRLAAVMARSAAVTPPTVVADRSRVAKSLSVASRVVGPTLPMVALPTRELLTEVTARLTQVRPMDPTARPMPEHPMERRTQVRPTADRSAEDRFSSAESPGPMAGKFRERTPRMARFRERMLLTARFRERMLLTARFKEPMLRTARFRELMLRTARSDSMASIRTRMPLICSRRARPRRSPITESGRCKLTKLNTGSIKRSRGFTT